MPTKCVSNGCINELYYGKKTALRVTVKPGPDDDVNPQETLVQVNSYLQDNFITHEMKWVDHMWISECVSFYSSLPFLIN